MSAHTAAPAPPASEFFDKPPLEIGQDEVLCFFTCYNEADRLPYFLEYYRSIGVNKFFAVDNKSTDKTADILKSSPDITYFYTEEDYGRNRSGVNWTDELANHYGMGRWCLTVDVDELVMFPGSEFCSIHDLTEYMDKNNQRVLFTVFLDMYGDGSLDETTYRPGTPFLDASRCFETHSYTLEWTAHFPPLGITGGPRRAFFEEGSTPTMRKCPLMKRGPDSCYVYSTHALLKLPLSDVVGATLHFKLFSDFSSRVEEQVNLQSRYMDIDDYKSYVETVKKRKVNFHSEHTHIYKDNMQLVELGVMTYSKDYISFLGDIAQRKLGPERSKRISNALSAARNKSMERAVLELRHLPQLWAMLTSKYENPLAAAPSEQGAPSSSPEGPGATGQSPSQLRGIQTLLSQREYALKQARKELKSRGEIINTVREKLAHVRQKLKKKDHKIERIESSIAWKVISRFVKY